MAKQAVTMTRASIWLFCSMLASAESDLFPANHQIWIYFTSIDKGGGEAYKGGACHYLSAPKISKPPTTTPPPPHPPLFPTAFKCLLVMPPLLLQSLTQNQITIAPLLMLHYVAQCACPGPIALPLTECTNQFPAPLLLKAPCHPPPPPPGGLSICRSI